MFLLKNTSVLLALGQLLVIWVFHFKSFVIVIPRYLMLSTIPYPRGCTRPQFYLSAIMLHLTG